MRRLFIPYVLLRKHFFRSSNSLRDISLITQLNDTPCIHINKCDSHLRHLHDIPTVTTVTTVTTQRKKRSKRATRAKCRLLPIWWIFILTRKSRERNWNEKSFGWQSISEIIKSKCSVDRFRTTRSNVYTRQRDDVIRTSIHRMSWRRNDGDIGKYTVYIYIYIYIYVVPTEYYRAVKCVFARFIFIDPMIYTPPPKNLMCIVNNVRGWGGGSGTRDRDVFIIRASCRTIRQFAVKNSERWLGDRFSRGKRVSTSAGDEPNVINCCETRLGPELRSIAQAAKLSLTCY